LKLPEFIIPDTMDRAEMPDLLRHWYLGPKARRHMMLRRFQEVDSELEAPEGATVLDIGSAWGFNVMALNRVGYRAIGLDLVIDQFEAGERIAVANQTHFDAVGADASALPFADGTFDRITMVETFEHIYLDDRPRALAEAARVLKPSGRLVLSTPSYGSAVERIKRFTGDHPWIRSKLPTMCYPEEGTSREAYHPYRYHRPLPDGQILAMLDEAGFRVVRVKHFLFVLKNTPDLAYQPLRIVERALEGTPGIRALAATVCFVADRA